MQLFQNRLKTSKLLDMVPEANAQSVECDKLDSRYLTEVLATLKLQQNRLHLLSSSTENEFLAIGARLQDFYTRTEEIGNVSVAFTEQMGGVEIQDAIRNLGGIVDRMDDFLNRLEEEAKQSRLTLGNTLQMIAGVYEPLAGFKKIMKVLNVLGISTKIESARLGPLGAGFHNLADDVKNLAVQINDKSARIIGENVSLSNKIRETLGHMDDIEADQREDVHLVLDKTRSSLEMITGVHLKCAEVASAIAEASGEVSRNLSQVVTSMQFHDITRQQLEHVQEALGDLECRLSEVQSENDRNSPGSESEKEIAVELFGVCRLQSGQLLHARDELTSAVSGIVQNLNGLADKGKGISRQTKEMVRVADGAGDSLFTEIERSLAPVVGLLAKSAAANYNLARAIDSVAETVAQISTFVIDIEAIGEEIKLIALNSQIKAALTGDEGAGLGVLAEAIQCLSVDACAQATAIACTLREITWVTEKLSRGAARETHTGELSVETMAGCLKTIIDSIRAMNDGVMATLAQSDAAAQDLSHDIESATGGIMTHGVITAEVDGIIGELDKIMAQAHRISPEAAMADLAALSARYTMHSERKIHAAFTGLGTADLCESALQNGETMTLLVSGVEESELGNNVELF